MFPLKSFVLKISRARMYSKFWLFRFFLNRKESNDLQNRFPYPIHASRRHINGRLVPFLAVSNVSNNETCIRILSSRPRHFTWEGGEMPCIRNCTSRRICTENKISLWGDRNVNNFTVFVTKIHEADFFSFLKTKTSKVLSYPSSLPL